MECSMTVRSLARAASVLVLAALASGCQSPFDDGNTYQDDVLADKRAVWASKNIQSYDFTVVMQCNCAFGTDPTSLTVNVRNGVPTPAANNALTGAQTAEFNDFDTVPELFDAVERAIEAGAVNLQVRYDDNLGVPHYINSDLADGSVKAKRIILVSSFQPVS
jgi:uncharacterized protein DUF6174